MQPDLFVAVTIVLAAAVFFWTPPFRRLRAHLRVSGAPQVELMSTIVEDRATGYFRVRVENVADELVHFGANLVAIDPDPGTVPLPLPLQITHAPTCQTVALPAFGSRAVDVFVAGEEGFTLLGVAHVPTIPWRCYRLTVEAYGHRGAVSRRTFEAGSNAA